MSFDNLHEQIQGDFADEGVVTGWLLVVEIGRHDGGKMLCHRTRKASGEALESWEQLALASASAALAESELLEQSRPPDDDDDE